MPEADAPTLGPDPGSTSVSTPPTSGPFPGDPQPFPASIGRYRILRLLGEGGMGMVYEAEQDFPQRIVALKVIRAGYATGEMLRRFENETQALGRLQHPSIAQIYDAGAVETPFGRQPYIAMELVRGQTLLDYCDSQKLTTQERLELMAKICDAVEHAHQRGLIHRDLKPANILVGEDGQPKILDFGVARLTDSDAQATRQTNMGEIIGTLAYMSPEQVSSEAADIDTRSDVYALGVILYEVLSGKAPYTIGRQIHEAVRAIRQDEPTALSSVNRTYRGDIETIVARALEKDKTRRYGSAAELAADIRRYLHDEPIVARPPTTTYQLRKFARRHKAVVSGIAAVFVVLALGVAASTWEAVQARRAQKVSERQTKEAERQTAIAKAVNDFLQNDLLGHANIYNQAKPDPNLSVRTVLDRAGANIGGKFKDQPEVEAAIRRTIGRTDDLMGLVPQAQQQLEQALSLSRRALGPEDPATLAIMADLAAVYFYAGKYAEAEKLYSQAAEVDRRVLGKENRQTLSATTELALTYSEEGKYAQSEALLRPTLDLEERLLGPADRNTGEAMDRLAWVYHLEQKYGLAETLDKRLLEIDRRASGPQSAVVFRDMDNLANIYDDDGKYPQAEALATQVVAFRRKVLGLDNKETLAAMKALFVAYEGEKKYAQAEALGQQTLERQRRVMGSDDPDTLATEENLAELYRLEGRFRLSESIATKALETERRVPGPASRATAEMLALLARDYTAQGRYSEAEDLLRQYSQGSSPNPEVAPNPEIDRAFAWFLLTASNPGRPDPARALALARRALVSEPDNPDRLKTLGLAEVRNGLCDEAIATLRKAAALHGERDPDDYLFLAQAYQCRGDAANADSNYERAVTLLVDVATADPDDVSLWRETAAALGKPAPSSSKKSASKSAGAL